MDITATEPTWWNRQAGGREVMQVAMPLVMASLSWTLLTFIDRCYLFHYSERAFAASFPAALLWWSLLSFPLGCCMYVQTFVAQYHGAQQHRSIGPIVWQGVWLAVLTVPFVLAFIPFAPALFQLAGHGTDVLAEEIDYFNTLNWGTASFLISYALSGFFAGKGQTWLVMIVDASAALLNALLDWWWIFGGLGLAPGGITGAAAATVVCFWIKVLVYLWLIWRPRHRRECDTLAVQFRPRLFGRLLYFGGASGLQILLEVAGFTTFVMLVGSLGVTQLAATNLAFNISSLAFQPVMGMAIAGSILVGQYLGANNPNLASRATWTTAVIGSIYMGAISTLYVVVPDWFLMGFVTANDSADQIEIRNMAVILLRFVAAYNLFDAWNMIFASAVKGAGDTVFVMLISLSMAAVLALATWIGLKQFDFGLYECWTLVTLWVCLLGILYWLRFQQGKWRSMRVIESV